MNREGSFKQYDKGYLALSNVIRDVKEGRCDAMYKSIE